jgi:GTPase SAR1 family protein
LLVFGLDSEASFNDVDGWLTDLRQLANPSAVVLLIGNKSDVSDRQVSESQGQRIAARHELDYLETSAKDGKGVEDAFVRLASKISDKLTHGQIVVPITPRADASNLQATRNAVERSRGENCC